VFGKGGGGKGIFMPEGHFSFGILLPESSRIVWASNVLGHSDIKITLKYSSFLTSAS